MDPQPVRSNILILKGVYPKDFAPIDTIYEKLPPVQPEANVVYTEMPRKFTSTRTWPEFSNLKCWECDQMPTGSPKFIPVNPERDADGNDICDVYGHFDEWNCAVRYIEREFSREQQWDALKLLTLFESKFSGRRREKIMPAPSKTAMKAYCGPSGITTKQYREKIASLNTDYDLSEYKLENYKNPIK